MSKLGDAIEKLADLFEYGALEAATNPVEFVWRVTKEVRQQRDENTRLTELWMDAVNQGAPRHHRDPGRLDDGALSTWEEAFPELEARGLAEGNPRDGYVLKWPERTS